MDFKALVQTTEYDFLRTDPHLGDRIILLGVGGSYGYGTNREGSDVDLRGIALNRPSDLLGLTSFEQFTDDKTDSVIYSFNKIVRLLLNCNPNIIELFGLEDYIVLTETGRELLDHKELFLSKRAAYSFGHYAESQLRRLENALARDSMTQSDRERHIMISVGHALDEFNRHHTDRDKGSFSLYIDKAETEGLDDEIFVDASLKHYPLRAYNEMMNTLNAVVRDYDRIRKLGQKKDDLHLNKHAMHLVRLYMMAVDILQDGVIRTRRTPEELELLGRIRDGEFMRDDRMLPEFYEIVAEYKSRFEEAARGSRLPENPDPEKVEAFVESVNRRVVENVVE